MNASSRSKDTDLKGALIPFYENLNKGEVSEMAVDADKGYIVYAADKKLPDLSPTSAQFAQMRASISGYMARLGAGSYLGELVAQELKRTEAALK